MLLEPVGFKNNNNNNKRKGNVCTASLQQEGTTSARDTSCVLRVGEDWQEKGVASQLYWARWVNMDIHLIGCSPPFPSRNWVNTKLD